MIKEKLEKTKKLIDKYKATNGVSNTEMASMYDIPKDISLEEKDKSIVNKGAVRILNDNMDSMYNLLKNKS
jgi:hypothetical protein